MFFRDYDIKIGELESQLHLLKKTLTKKGKNNLTLNDDGKDRKVSLTLLEPLTESLKDAMLLMKPEKARSIERKYTNMKQSLDKMKSGRHDKRKIESDSDQKLYHFQSFLKDISVFLDLGKKIRKNPSPTIEDIIKLKEMYDAKEYISTIEAPEILNARLRNLVNSIDAFNRSLLALEKSVEATKNRLSAIQETGKKFRSISLDLLEKK